METAQCSFCSILYLVYRSPALEEINQHISSVTLAAFVFLFFIVFFLSFLFFYFKKFYRLEAEKKQLELQLEQEVSKARIEIQEVLFEKLSLDIHDNVNQTLSLAKLQLSQINPVAQSDSKLLAEAKHNISDAISTLRHMAKSMNGDSIVQAGLHNAIRQLVGNINTTDLLHIEFTETGKPFTLAPNTALVLFRMVQEALQNVLKHAEASLVKLELQYNQPNIRINIHDNGKGFDPLANNQKGLGLNSLYKRAALLGGTLSITSKALTGTTILIDI